MKTKTKQQLIAQIGEHGINNLERIQEGQESCDLHHELYNMDYFIMGTYQAKEFLKEYDVFEAIEKVQEYEQDHFGEVNTDLGNPEKLVNMLAYIIGEELLQACPTLEKRWNDKLSTKDIEIIKKELKKAVKLYND
jgi:hypothetical protein